MTGANNHRYLPDPSVLFDQQPPVDMKAQPVPEPQFNATPKVEFVEEHTEKMDGGRKRAK